MASLDQIDSALRDLVLELKKLPGIGEKTATRLAFFLIRTERGAVESLAAALAALHDDIQTCAVCCALTTTSPCELCGDPQRASDVICVVEWADKFPQLLPAATEWWQLVPGPGGGRAIEPIVPPPCASAR